MKRLILPTLLGVALSGCSSSGVFNRLGLDGDFPRTGTLVPSGNIQLSPSISIATEKLVFWGAYVGVAYLILDPLAPNWSIQEAQMPNSHYHLALHMKRYYVGGAGEARVVFHRRAKELAQAEGFEGYQVLEYNEGMESSVLGTQRVAKGVILLTERREG